MRKSVVPKREIQVLKRLREAREKLGLAQPDFAAQIGITRGRLGNYEYGLTPLPCDLAFKICQQFILGERWLATGKGPMRQYIALSLAVENPMLYRMPFGEAYDKHLSDWAETEAALMTAQGALFTVFRPAFWNSNEHFYRNFINALFDNWFEQLKKGGKQEDLGDLVKMLAVSGYEHLSDLLERELKHDSQTDEPYWFYKSTGQRKEFYVLDTEAKAKDRSIKRIQERADKQRNLDLAMEELLHKKKAKK